MSTEALPEGAEVRARIADQSLPAYLATLATTVVSGSARHALVRALSIALPSLLDRPELALQHLWERVYFSARHTETLRAWLEQWRREAPPTVAWLRALRPSLPSVDTALVQEFIAPIATEPVELAFVGDGDVLARSGASVMGWSRSRGRALWPIPSFDPHRWRVHYGGGDRQSTPIVDASGAAVFSVPRAVDGAWTCVRALPGLSSVIVGGWCDEYEGLLARYERRGDSLVQRWIVRLPTSVRSLAISADGTLVAAALSRDVLLIDPSDGATIATLGVRATGVALLSDNSVLATLDGPFVRVWDVRALRAGAGYSEPEGTAVGRVDAQFSEDSSRVLCGGLLLDAASGARIATLQLDSMNYLEGGPPSDAAGLFGDRVVEVGARAIAFSLRDGSRIPLAKVGFFTHSHNVRVAPDGRSILVARTRGANARHIALQTGAELGALDAGPSPMVSIEWSPSGAWVVTTHADGVARLWSIATHAVVATVTARGDRVRWAADSARFAIEATDGAQAWFTLDAKAAEAPLSDASPWVVTGERGQWTLSRDGARVELASVSRPVVDRTATRVATRTQLFAIEPAQS